MTELKTILKSGDVDGLVFDAGYTPSNDNDAARKIDVDAKENANSNIQAHIGTTGNPHGVTSSDVGLLDASLINRAVAAQYGESTNNGPILNALLDLSPVSQQAVLNAGFTENGAGFVYDPVKGVQCTAGSIDLLNPFASLMAAEGSIYLEVERQGVAIDETQNLTTFLQSTGDVSAGARYLMNLDQSGTDELRLFWEVNANFGGLVETGASQLNYGVPVNSNASSAIDSEFMRIIITWSGTAFRVIYDGIVIEEAVLTNPMNSTVLTRIRLGSRGGATQPFNYFIKRIQLSDKLFTPVFEPQKTVIFGDSFATALFNDKDLATLNDYAAAANTSLVTNGGGYDIAKSFWKDRGKLLSIVSNSTTEAGHGYANAGNPFSAATKTAVGTANPEYIICLGSINDVSNFVPYANILADTKAVLDILINGSTNLRKILFFETFPGHQNLPNNTQAFRDNYEQYILEQSAIDGYRGIVKYIPTFQDFGGLNYSIELTIGSATGNIVDPDNNLHPSRLGHIKMAEIMYPEMINNLYQRELI